MWTVSGERQCAECGKTFPLTTWNQKYCCEECRANSRRVAERVRMRKKRTAQKKVKKQTCESLSEVARKANAMGLTYGQYMQRCQK